jgi:L-rhamnose mutarotase
MDDEGYIFGFLFRVFDDGNVLFSKLDMDITNYVEDMPEIPESTFVKVWEEQIKNIVEGNNYSSNK